MRIFLVERFNAIKDWLLSHLPGAKKWAEIAKQGRRYALVGVTATTIDIVLLIPYRCAHRCIVGVSACFLGQRDSDGEFCAVPASGV